MQHILSIVGFLCVTLAVQGGSHFWLNKTHYDALSFTRDAPIMPMGIGAILIQGFVMSMALQLWRGEAVSLQHGLIVAAGFGFFLGSYIVLAEPAKYAAPSILDWMRIEGTSTLVQFSVFGVILGFVHQKFG